MIGPTASDIIEDLQAYPKHLGDLVVLTVLYYMLPSPSILSLEEEMVLGTSCWILLFAGILTIKWYHRQASRMAIGAAPTPIEVVDPHHHLRQGLVSLAHAAFLEELIFRGVLLRGMSPWTGPLVALMVGTLIWALLHRRPKLLPFDLGVGLLFGSLVLFSSIWTAIALHLAINLHSCRNQR